MHVISLLTLVQKTLCQLCVDMIEGMYLKCYHFFWIQAPAKIAIWALLMPKNKALSAVKVRPRSLFLYSSNKIKPICKTTNQFSNVQ